VRGLTRLAALAALLLAILAIVAVIGDRAGVEVVRNVPPRRTPEPFPVVPLPRAVPAPAVSHAFPRDASAGLAVIDRGLRVAVTDPVVSPGGPTLVRFSLGGGGKRRRVVATVVRRDGRFLQRVRARDEAGGDLAARLRLPKPGAYRMIVDVDDGRRVVGIDLFAPGDFRPLPLPAPSALSQVDGYVVRARGARERLRLVVERGGRAVDARGAGALVAIRAGDLAYAAALPRGGSGRAPRFTVQYPGAGVYRVFVPFSDGGRVHVAAFTRDVAR